jgi:hypothetical protein
MGGLGVIGPEKFAQYFTGHPAVAQAYAWSSPMEGSNKRRFFAVFRQPPITSPVEAVRAAIVAQHHGDGS